MRFPTGTTCLPETATVQGPRRVKFGIDPTGDRLHLGHLVALRLLNQALREGCEVTVVLGTFTAQCGDPSGRDQARPALSAEEVERNAAALEVQLRRFLLPGFRVFRNGDLHGQLSLADFLDATAGVTVGQLLARDSFRRRAERGDPLSVPELMVPLLQGLDSVALRTEVEIGGRDQLFNFQLSREMQAVRRQMPQTCVMVPLLCGTDGRKMSKSFGNCVFLDEEPRQMFAQLMRVTDAALGQMFLLLTDEQPSADPVESRMRLALNVVGQVHGVAAAKDACRFFRASARGTSVPTDAPPLTGVCMLLEAVAAIRGCSKKEARRLLAQGAVFVDGQRMTEDGPALLGEVVRAGRRQFGVVS